MIFNSPDKIKKRLEELCDSGKGYFTGYVKIAIEMNEILELSEEPTQSKAEIKDKSIPQSKFEDLKKYYESPLDCDEETRNLAEGLPKEKFEKALELNAESIIKKPCLKLNGSVVYKFLASILEDDE